MKLSWSNTGVHIPGKATFPGRSLYNRTVFTIVATAAAFFTPPSFALQIFLLPVSSELAVKNICIEAYPDN